MVDYIAIRNDIVKGMIAPVRENEWVTERNRIADSLMSDDPTLTGYEAIAVADERMREQD